MKRIYALVRPRTRPDGSVQGALERLRREIFETAIFSRLRQVHGERFWAVIEEKVVPVPGDLTEADLGIPSALAEAIRAEVDVVIHGAASVFFDERIDHAVEMNTLGPERLVELTRTFRKPAVFTFVSTAYVSGARTGPVPELPPDPSKSAAELAGRPGAPSLSVEHELGEIQAFTREVQAAAAARGAEFREEAERLRAAGEPGEPEAVARELEQRWLEKRLVDEGMRRARRLGWHEVYTFTKAMGEALVVTHRGDLPVALVRPSIIESSLAEPEPGWINGLKVADPLIAGYAKGRIPDFPGRRDSVLDLIPVDFVANAILAATERTARERGMVVYHVATGSRNPIRVGQCFDLMQTYYRRHPMRDKTGEPIRARDWSFPAAWWFRARYQYGVRLPLRVAPRSCGRRRSCGRPASPRSSSTAPSRSTRLLYYTDIYSPYTSLACSFESTNTKRLFDGLSPDDRKTFNFDIEAIDWPSYIQDVHLSGLDRHVLRFGRSDGAVGRRRGASARPRVSTEDLRTVPDLLRLCADRFADKVALQVKRDGTWVRLTVRRPAPPRRGSWARSGAARGCAGATASCCSPRTSRSGRSPTWPRRRSAQPWSRSTSTPRRSRIEQIVEFTEARAAAHHAQPLPGAAEIAAQLAAAGLGHRRGRLPVRRARPAPAADPHRRRRPLGGARPRRRRLDHLHLGAGGRSARRHAHAPQLHRQPALALGGAALLRDRPLHLGAAAPPCARVHRRAAMPLFSGAMVTYAQTLKSKVILELMEETGATAILAVPRIFEMLLDRLRRSPEATAGHERAPRAAPRSAARS